MKILAGRSFSEKFGSDWESVIINETVCNGLNFKNPEEAIDKIVFISGRQFKIIGVIADYNQVSPKLINTPIVIRFHDRVRNYLSVNINVADNENTIKTINKLWNEIFPNDPFNYYFLNDYYDKQYSLDIQFSKIMNFFAIITIVIICLGLWALSSHTITLRTKEIAIRKVLNASRLDIILLLFKYFNILILAASAISLPIAYYFSKNWLNNFAYKITIGWWFFVLPIIVITAITILIIGYGILKVSKKNLAETLKYE
jgi:putative ABC transport system permease protein